jgi:hypothetical protein
VPGQGTRPLHAVLTGKATEATIRSAKISIMNLLDLASPPYIDRLLF